ncbi:hypothetical protein OIE66_40380 [Nonomuraea sp. NBC_01738]|uniref:hypothetical protein n=1 Tax=Nonomuraea sp. NBC_01738 TaxID=2976003 RepID=UPI002E0E478F|nr:hypothetical protein OIE66_40380 [Nonomuraea sp. NBC_01738]
MLADSGTIALVTGGSAHSRSTLTFRADLLTDCADCHAPAHAPAHGPAVRACGRAGVRACGRAGVRACGRAGETIVGTIANPGDRMTSTLTQQHDLYTPTSHAKGADPPAMKVAANLTHNAAASPSPR